MARTFVLRDINLLFWQASKVRGITDGEGQGYRGGEIADPDLDIFVPSASRMDDGTILGSDGNIHHFSTTSPCWLAHENLLITIGKRASLGKEIPAHVIR